jgi:undecaprenyl-diphosphatase
MAQADGYFLRHGGKTIFFGRWIGFLRSLAPLLAGSARMSYPKFLLYDLAGAISWGVTLTALGFVFGRSLSVVEQWMGRLTLFLVLFFVAVIGLALLARWLRSKGAAIGALAAGLADEILALRPVRAVDRRFHRELAWVARRFSPRQTFGLGLTLGLITSSLLLYLFAVITRAVLERTPLVRVDGLVAGELHERAFGSLTFMAEATSFLTASWFTVGVSLIVGAAIIFWRRLLLDAIVLLASAVGAGVLAQVLKLLIQRPRPAFAESLVDPTGYSFPSGHVTSSTAFYLALALLATGWVRRWETRVYIILGLVVLLLGVGFSRLYLGAHYLTDVLGGYAAGAFWAAICITGAAVLMRAQAGHEAAANKAGAPLPSGGERPGADDGAAPAESEPARGTDRSEGGEPVTSGRAAVGAGCAGEEPPTSSSP